jgi:hypothetical protein
MPPHLKTLPLLVLLLLTGCRTRLIYFFNYLNKILRKMHHMIGVTAQQVFQTLMPPGYRDTRDRGLFCCPDIT